MSLQGIICIRALDLLIEKLDIIYTISMSLSLK